MCYTSKLYIISYLADFLMLELFEDTPMLLPRVVFVAVDSVPFGVLDTKVISLSLIFEMSAGLCFPIFTSSELLLVEEESTRLASTRLCFGTFERRVLLCFGVGVCFAETLEQLLLKTKTLIRFYWRPKNLGRLLSS